jgi:hypothetical protein
MHSIVRMLPEHTPTSFLVLHPDRESFVQGVPVFSSVAIGVAPAVATAGVLLGGGMMALAAAGTLAAIGIIASIVSFDD